MMQVLLVYVLEEEQLYDAFSNRGNILRSPHILDLLRYLYRAELRICIGLLVCTFWCVILCVVK